MLHFATLFDINYLSRGLTLFHSLRRECKSSPFTFYVLALDTEVQNYFHQNPEQNLIIIGLNQVEEAFEELQTAKNNRSKVEYYFTLSPYWPLYILDNYKEVNQITTMDADLYFFSDPIKIFDTYADSSVLITPHNFSKNNADLVGWGKFNVSFQSFKRDENGLACLEKWRAQCSEWCYDYLDSANTRFADQKYLDQWQNEFDQVHSIELKGTGLAPWNIENFALTYTNNKIFADGEALIYFHFQHLRIFNKQFALHGFSKYNSKINSTIKRIYHHYLLELKKHSIVYSEGKILRNNEDASKSIITKLLKTDGYFFFTKAFIIALNPYKSLAKLKSRFIPNG